MDLENGWMDGNDSSCYLGAHSHAKTSLSMKYTIRFVDEVWMLTRWSNFIFFYLSKNIKDSSHEGLKWHS